jgi:single-strand DNA-binding protein
MYDTNIVVVGNALTVPEWRRFERTNALVANFKIASTSRRYDKSNSRWTDGDSLRLRVTCWRRLAEGVVASVKVGDPVVVTGRLYTREWTTEDGQRRTAYELEAVSVGHDLARGVGAFRRGRINLNTTVVEDAETDKHVNGEPTEAAPEENRRSEALAANLGAGINAGLDEEGIPTVGFDGPVNREPIGSIADLGTVLTSELADELDETVERAVSRFGGGARADRTDGIEEDGIGEDGNDETFDEAAMVGAAEVATLPGVAAHPEAEVVGGPGKPAARPEPGRGRRGWSRVPASV